MEMAETPSASTSTADQVLQIEEDRASVHSSLIDHTEKHFEGAEIIQDIVIGLSDGLTVPFALTAGLSNLGESWLVVTAGLAEIVAGAISMGLGGWLAGRSEIEHYYNERRREDWEVDNCLQRELQEIVEIFEPYGLDKVALQPLLETLSSNKEKFVDFMMRFELNLEKPSKNRAWQSALTIGGSYFFGGLVPIFPYFFEADAYTALWISIALTVAALAVFGFVKGRLEGARNIFYSALETTVVGAIAAAASFGIAKLVIVYFPQ